MNITGIIVEYNPFHNGHAYHISKARTLTGCDAVVAAMSGDFVQRGEPAIVDKWARTRQALDNGVDLVIEIPVLFCLDYAGRFAAASVGLLEMAGCRHIVFGSETGDMDMIVSLAEDLKRQEEGHAGNGSAWKYPGPNDHLASEYVLHMKTAEPVLILRQGAGYHDGFMENTASYQSATAIREMIRNGEDISPYVPKNVSDALQGIQPVGRDDTWEMLKDAIRSTAPALIDDCPSGGEGIGTILREEVTQAHSYDKLLQAVQRKRWNRDARLSRLFMQVLLGVTRTRYRHSSPSYIRVLGYNEQGKCILERLQSEGGLPIITDPGRDSAGLSEAAEALLALDEHAGDIYQRIRPVMFGKTSAVDAFHTVGVAIAPEPARLYRRDAAMDEKN